MDAMQTAAGIVLAQATVGAWSKVTGTIEHKVLKNADGSPLRARVNGKIKTWKTRPGEFRLPMKHGLKFCFYITQHNCGEWNYLQAAVPFAKP